MFSDITNDAIVEMVKENPQFELLINHIISENKKTTSMFVHELRNPLTLLKSTFQYIEQKHPEAKEFKYWDQLQELIADMEHILTDASALNTCNHLNKENTNLITLIYSIVNSFMPQAHTQMIDLSVSIAPGCEEYFSCYYCDAPKLKQVLANLIKNAFEATFPGNFIHIGLDLLTEDFPTSTKLLIQISDNGQMIPEDVIETIFSPFVTYKQGGTGVGLALAKRIMNLHYGNILAESSKELTSFTMLLPLLS